VNAEDVLDEKPKEILSAVWVLISCVLADSLGATQGGSGSVKKQLLGWAQQMLGGEEELELQNFGGSWSDGVALCLLARKLGAHLEVGSEPAANLERAFAVLEEQYAVPRLLDAAQTAGAPDESSVMTYVALVRKVFVTQQQLAALDELGGLGDAEEEEEQVQEEEQKEEREQEEQEQTEEEPKEEQEQEQAQPPPLSPPKAEAPRKVLGDRWAPGSAAWERVFTVRPVAFAGAEPPPPLLGCGAAVCSLAGGAEAVERAVSSYLPPNEPLRQEQLPALRDALGLDGAYDDEGWASVAAAFGEGNSGGADARQLGT